MAVSYIPRREDAFIPRREDAFIPKKSDLVTYAQRNVDRLSRPLSIMSRYMGGGHMNQGMYPNRWGSSIESPYAQMSSLMGFPQPIGSRNGFNMYNAGYWQNGQQAMIPEHLIDWTKMLGYTEAKSRGFV